MDTIETQATLIAPLHTHAALSTYAAALNCLDLSSLSINGFPNMLSGFPAYYSLILFRSRSSEWQE